MKEKAAVAALRCYSTTTLTEKYVCRLIWWERKRERERERKNNDTCVLQEISRERDMKRQCEVWRRRCRWLRRRPLSSSSSKSKRRNRDSIKNCTLSVCCTCKCNLFKVHEICDCVRRTGKVLFSFSSNVFFFFLNLLFLLDFLLSFSLMESKKTWATSPQDGIHGSSRRKYDFEDEITSKEKNGNKHSKRKLCVHCTVVSCVQSVL